MLRHAYPQQWLPTRANPDPCEWTLTYSGSAPLACDQLVQALLTEALLQRPVGRPLQSVQHQPPAQRPAVLKQERGQQTREEEQSSLLLVTHWKPSQLGSENIKNDKSTKWLQWSRSWGMKKFTLASDSPVQWLAVWQTQGLEDCLKFLLLELQWIHRQVGSVNVKINSAHQLSRSVIL